VIRPTLPQVFSWNVIVNIAGTCRTAAPVTVTCDRAVPEESRGGPINYSDADAGQPVPQLGQLAAFIPAAHPPRLSTAADRLPSLTG